MEIEIIPKKRLKISDRTVTSVTVTDIVRKRETKISDIGTVIEIFNICYDATDQKEGIASLDKSVYQERQIFRGKRIISLDVATLCTSNQNPIDLTIEFKGKKDKSQPILIFSINKNDFIRDSSSFIYFYRKGIYQEILSFM